MDKSISLTKLIQESLEKMKSPKHKNPKLYESIKSLVKEVIQENKQKELKEGLFVTSWKKVKSKLDSARDWNEKKAILTKEIEKSNVDMKGGWLKRINAVADEKAMEAFINELDQKPGPSIEDKLEGASKGAATSAIFRENKKPQPKVVKPIKK